MLHELMQARRPTMDWWRESVRALQDQGVRVAVTGAVAANAYMPARQTGDLDLAVSKIDLGRSGESLASAGWRFLGDLRLYDGLSGTAWGRGSDEIDLIGLPGTWGRSAITLAQDNRAVNDLPTLTMPYVVVMKLVAARPQDTADIARMLGAASDAALDEVRAVVRRSRPADLEDLEQMVAAGRLEFGPR